MKLFLVTTVPITLFFFTDQVAFLIEKGFEVHAVSSPDKELGEFGRKMGIRVHGVKMARQPAPMQDLQSLLRLTRLFAREKPDLVHVHTPKAGLLGTIAARVAGVKVTLFTVHGLVQTSGQGMKKRLLDFLTTLSCRLADRVFCVSPSLMEHLVQERLCSPTKAVVLGKGSVSGVEALVKFNPDQVGGEARLKIRAQHGIPGDAMVLGYVGRIVRDKGVGELTRAWKILRDAHPGLYLILVGFFEASDSLDHNDEALLKNDPRVILTGWRENVPEYLAAMDIFVCPSYREGFGMANLEASAMRLPVVSTRIPGCVDSVLDTITGTLVPPGDWPALKAGIEEYIQSPELCTRHGAAGRERVLKDFRPADLCRALSEEYHRLLT